MDVDVDMDDINPCTTVGSMDMDMDMNMDTDTILAPSSSSSSSIQSSSIQLELEDRLSSLPDEVLIGILCLLPAKDAAALCALSKRLRLLFSFITSLDLDVLGGATHPDPDPCKFQQHLPAFVAFVHSLLSSYHFPYLTSFTLRLSVDFHTIHFANTASDQCLPHLTSYQIQAWLSFPFTRCGNALKKLDLCIHTQRQGQEGFHQLPPAIFTCRSLENLKLNVNLRLDQLYAMSSFCLPNLKLLHLRASHISGAAFVSRLVSSCPLLEDLTIEAFWDRFDFLKICSSSLRRLCLVVFRKASVNTDELVVIDTPNLEDFEYFDEEESYHYSLANLDHVATAAIQIENALKVVDCFLRPLSNVKHLYLNGCLTDDLDSVEVMDHLPPVFPNLDYLHLGCHGCVYWDIVLLAFLNRSPVLETLVFGEGLVVYDDRDPHREAVELEQEYFRTAQVSNLDCCKSHLKRIVIHHYFGNEREIVLLGFLLRHALVLEELVIFPSQRPEDKSMETTLRNLPKASNNCTLLFNY